ncbi:MAG: fumarate hydratase [Thermoprotei archaeon]|nr:MAG: fumarate hydratase [Thermoprotei archaeon]
MEHLLHTPITEDEVRRLHVGDIVYLSGIVVTARDAAHRRLLQLASKGAPPMDFKGLAIYHCGPIVKKSEDGSYIVVSAGPTTSARLEHFTELVVKVLGVKLIIGKGGMGKTASEIMRRHTAAYLTLPGGAGAIAAKAIKRVVDVKWLDLGMPEALWVFEVDSLGPLIVTIDTHGRNLHLEVIRKAVEKAKRLSSGNLK